ncbi:tetratricopeptide repeat protein [Nocardia farcinica]|nr:hypothetical protein [Nocardia farcinica]
MSGERGGFRRGGPSEGGSRYGAPDRGDDRGGAQRGGFRRGASDRDDRGRGGFDRGGAARGAGGGGEREGSERGGFRRGGERGGSSSGGERGGYPRGGSDSRGADRGPGRGGSGFDATARGGSRDAGAHDDAERGASARGGERGGFPRGGDERRGSGARGEFEDRRRGGEGARGTGGRNLERRAPRPEEPDLPDDVEASDLDPAVRRDLLSLDKGNAETVARHLVMAVRLLDDDPRLALAHARAARQRAGRIAVVRETAGVVAYHAGEWAEALSELRTARRMSGGSGLLAVMADCERGLGRPERAIELGRSDEARALTGDEASELRIVVAGARMDLGQYDQAVVTLQTDDLDPERTGSSAARLFYAYADALVAAGRTAEGLEWFLNAAAADLDGETDAEDRAAELTGDA